MSIASFNSNFSGSVKLTGSAAGTEGFVWRNEIYSGFGGSFQAEYQTQGTALTIKEQTCQVFPDTAKDYVRPAFISGITESGFTNLGFPNYVEKTFLNKNVLSNYGEWIPNDRPELKYELNDEFIGKVEVDGEYTTVKRVYIVKHPDGLGKDVPILLPAGIVTVNVPAIVYEGDIIYIYPNNISITPDDPENFLVRIIRQKRYPKPDRTFYWTPNTEPILTKGGYVDGVLAKPGTVMIPTFTTSLRAYDGGIPPPPEIPPDKILPIDYVYAGQGIMFDGDDWVTLSGVPTRLLKKDETYAHRNEGLASKYIDEDQPYIALTESFYANRPNIILSAPVDSSPSGQANLTAATPPPSGDGTPVDAGQDVTLSLDCPPRAVFYLLYDFGDAWSKYHQGNKDWRDAIITEYETIYTFGFGAATPPEIDPETGEPLEEFTIFARSQTFRDGEVTVVEIKDKDGNVVLTSSLSINIRVENLN
jgi:hypothetical protein